MFKSRDIKVMNECQNVKLKTENKLLTEHALEHAEDIKGCKDNLRKIN